MPISSGIALIMQPHIMSKSLYLRSERDVNVYLATAMIVGTVFTSVLLVGLFARLELGANLVPDRVVATYIFTHFSATLRAVVGARQICDGTKWVKYFHQVLTVL